MIQDLDELIAQEQYSRDYAINNEVIEDYITPLQDEKDLIDFFNITGGENKERRTNKR